MPVEQNQDKGKWKPRLSSGVVIGLDELNELRAENAALKKRVAELEARLGQERGDERPTNAE